MKLISRVLSLFVLGCGAGDYQEIPTIAPREEKVVEALDWREAAMKAKESPALLIPPQSGAEGNKDCPEATLCIRAPYLGPWQWRELASRFPGHVTTKDSGGAYQITIGNAVHIQIEADIFEHDGGTLFLCGNDNLISTSLFHGCGLFDSSGTACDRMGGGNISLIAYEINGGPNVRSDGRAGANGADGKLAEGDLRAVSGDPAAAKIGVDVKWVKGRWSITKAAADSVGEGGAETAISHLHDLAALGLYSEDSLESHLKANGGGCEKGAALWYESPNAGCFFYFQNEGLFDGASARIDNTAGLNGHDADASKVMKGGDGEDGGSSGLIRILSSKTSRAPKSELSAVGAKGGAGGKGAYQLPGLGALAKLEKVSQRISEKHFVGCLLRKNGKLVEVHDWNAPASRVLDLSFSSDGAASYDRAGKVTGSLAAPRGSDGRAISSSVIETLTGRGGRDGATQAPEVQFETDPDFLDAFHRLCATCSVPQVVSSVSGAGK